MCRADLLCLNRRSESEGTYLPMNHKVGRVAPRAPQCGPVPNGARGATRPTNARRFEVSIHVRSRKGLRRNLGLKGWLVVAICWLGLTACNGAPDPARTKDYDYEAPVPGTY